jgi:hypothetical protein
MKRRGDVLHNKRVRLDNLDSTPPEPFQTIKTMFARFAAVSLLLLQATVVLGEPVPIAAPTAAPIAKRDVFGSIASAATSVFGDATSGAANGAENVYSFVTSEYHIRQNTRRLTVLQALVMSELHLFLVLEGVYILWLTMALVKSLLSPVMVRVTFFLSSNVVLTSCFRIYHCYRWVCTIHIGCSVCILEVRPSHLRPMGFTDWSSSATHSAAASTSRTPVSLTLTYSLVGTVAGIVMGAAFIF